MTPHPYLASVFRCVFTTTHVIAPVCLQVDGRGNCVSQIIQYHPVPSRFPPAQASLMGWGSSRAGPATNFWDNVAH